MTALASINNQTSLAPSPMSPQGFANASAILRVNTPVTASTALIPLKALDNVIAMIDGERKDTPIPKATALCDILLGQNPSNKADNPRVYYNTLLAILCSYPQSICEAAVHPVEGIVANSQYQVKPSDLKKWMDEKIVERARVRSNAIAQKTEHARREKENERDAQIERERSLMSPEQRAERANEVRRMFNLEPLKAEKTS